MDAAETIPGARLVAAADRDQAKVGKAAEGRPSSPVVYRDYREALTDESVDVVVIGVPTHLHSEVAVAAARAGKHIYCEKAMAASPSQCRTMMSAAHEHGVKLTVGHSTRFRPACLMARRLIERGDIGEVFAVNAQFSASAEPPSRGATDSWRYQAGSAGNGHVINFGCHYIDTARFFVGQDPVSVSAHIANLFSMDMIYEDQFCITSTCARGAIISISLYCSAQGTGAPTDGYTIRGSEGTIHVASPGAKAIAVKRGRSEPEAVSVDADLAGEGPFMRLHRLFQDAIEHDGEVPVTGEDALRNVEWGLAAYVSSGERRWVDLPLGQEYDDFMGPVLDRTIPATRDV